MSSNVARSVFIRPLAGIFFACALALTVQSQTFTNHTGVGLPGIQYGGGCWGDFDNDNDLDFVFFGETNTFQTIGRYYRNNGDSTFTLLSGGVPAVDFVSAVPGDFDNDGDLDLLVTGTANNNYSGYDSAVYRNNGSGVFTRLDLGLRALKDGAAAWVDFDNDGALDIAICGHSAPGDNKETHLYQNNRDGTFTEVMANLVGVNEAAMTWGDYDNDGDMDLFLAGYANFDSLTNVLYRNDGNHVFTPVPTTIRGSELTFRGSQFASAAWGDFDNDGYLDLAYSGSYYGTAFVSVYHNNSDGTFSDPQGFPAVFGRVAWGDFDNDGWLDLVMVAGFTNYDAAEVLHNEPDSGGVRHFVAFAGLPHLGNNQLVAWGDYQGDGRLDLLLSGYEIETKTRRAYLFGNATPVTNTPPSAPSGLSATALGSGRVLLKWHAASDNQTPAAGLNYNLRIGTSPGASDVVSPAADTATGFRRVVERGNVPSGTNAWLNLPPGTYYWSVQAVDGAFAGGPFAAGSSFSLTDSPRLDFSRQGASAVLSWPLKAADYSLVASTILTADPATWSGAGLTRQTNGNTISVTAPIGTGVKFFQLRK